MNSEMQATLPAPVPEPVRYSVPWKPIDNWIGVLLLALIDGSLFGISRLSPRGQLAQSGLLVIVQLAFLLPVVIIFAYRRISWRVLGFGKFSWGTLGLGCGLLIGGYAIILLHNAVLTVLGVQTQGQEITQLFGALNPRSGSSLSARFLLPWWRRFFFGVFFSRDSGRGTAGSQGYC